LPFFCVKISTEPFHFNAGFPETTHGSSKMKCRGYHQVFFTREIFFQYFSRQVGIFISISGFVFNDNIIFRNITHDQEIMKIMGFFDIAIN